MARLGSFCRRHLALSLKFKGWSSTNNLQTTCRLGIGAKLLRPRCNLFVSFHLCFASKKYYILHVTQLHKQSPSTSYGIASARFTWHIAQYTYKVSCDVRVIPDVVKYCCCQGNHATNAPARQATCKKLDILAIKFWGSDDSKNSGDLHDSN